MSTWVRVGVVLLASHAFARGHATGQELQASVNEPTGTAEVVIPIVVPPGTAGLTPALALSYDSGAARGGAGFLGTGWSVEGLGAIERDRRFGPPFDFEGGPVCGGTFCYRDDFVLDGAALVPEPSGAGLYRLRSDDGRRIEFRGETAGWEIRDRRGKRLVFGASDSARVRSDRNGQVFAWLLERVEDPQGNWIEYRYVGGTGVRYPAEIRYAQAGAGANRTVRFVLDAARPDRALRFDAGFRQQIDRRLAAIEVLAAGDALVTRYELEYAQSTDSTRSLLASVQRVGADGQQTWPRPYAFTYARSAHAFDATSTSHFVEGDVSYAGYFPIWFEYEDVMERTLDLDVDGLMDVLLRASGAWRWYRATSSGLEPAAVWDSGNSAPLLDSVPEGVAGCAGTYRQLVDMDADGYLDTLDATAWFSPNWRIRRGSASGFDTPPGGASYEMVVAPGQTSSCGVQDRLPMVQRKTANGPREVHTTLVDMTGDGRPDRVTTRVPGVNGTGSWHVYVNAAAPASGQRRLLPDPVAWPDPANRAFWNLADQSYQVLDVNGDGLPDRVWRPSSGWVVAYGWGAGFESVGEPLEGPDLPPQYFSLIGSEVDALADLNGDGFVDRIEPDGRDPWLVWFGTGTGFRPTPVAWSGLAPGAFWGFPRDLTAIGSKADLADWNGDGLPDRILLTSEIYLNRGPVPDLLVLAAGPQGGSARFEYASSAEMVDASGARANPAHPRAHPVVTRLAFSAGRPDAPEIADDLEYRRGQFDRGEREFRGFGEVARVRREDGDPTDAGTELVSTYDTTAACAGRLVARETRRGATVYAREAHELVAQAHPAGWASCLPVASVFEAVEGDESGRKIRRVARSYDADSNPTRIEEWTDLDLEQGVSGQTGPRLDRVTELAYAEPVNPSTQLVSHLRELRIAAGADPSVTLDLRRFHYDARSDGRVSSGLLTRVEAWLEHPPEDPVQEAARFVAEAVLEYDVYGNPSRLRGPATASDANGLETSITYDGTYRTFATARVEGSDSTTPRSTFVAYTGCAPALAPPPALGLPCAISTLDGRSDRFGYDALGRVVRREHAGGLVETRAYAAVEPAASLEEITLELATPQAATLRYVGWLDGLGRAFEEESPGTAGRTVRVRRRFDERGRLAAETLPHFAGEAQPPPERAFGYDPLGRLSRVTDYDGSTERRWTHTPWAVVEETHSGAGSSWLGRRRRLFDGYSNLIEVADYQSLSTLLRTQASYDALGRIVEVRDPLKNDASLCQTWRAQYGWTPDGAGPICPAGGAYPTTRIHYDTLGRRVRIDDPDAGTWTWRYDDAGLLVRESQGAPGVELAYTTFAYDGLQRRIEERVWPTGMGATHASFAYGATPGSGAYGKLVSVRGLGSAATRARYDYFYDAHARLERERQTSEGRAFENVYVYDELGRVARRGFPDGTDFSFLYDGRELVRIDAADSNGVGGYVGRVLNAAEYDALGRLVRLELGDHSGAGGSEAPIAQVDYGYDATTARLSSLTAWRTPGEPFVYDLRFEFDGLGRLLRRTGRSNYFDEPIDESFAYDPLGRLVEAIGPWERPEGNADDVRWVFSYDPLGNLRTQRTDDPDPDTAYERTWTQGDYRHPRRLTRLEGVQQGVSWQETTSHDAAGRVLDRAAGSTLQRFRWGPRNRVWELGSSNHRQHYDAFRSLVVEERLGSTIIHAGADFEYDTALGQAIKFFFVGGQRIASLATHYAAPPATATLAWPDRTPSHDWALRHLGTPTAVALLGLGFAGLAVLPRRRREPLWLALPGVAMLSAAVILAPGSARPGGGGGFGPSPRGGHGELILFYLPDQLGSTRAVVDLFGAVVEARDYDPFGRTTRHRGDYALKHRFTSQPMHDDVGVYDYGARPYDPLWGRFLAPDELVQSFDSQGLNSYAYVLNQPTSLVDPTGRFGFPSSGVLQFSSDFWLGVDSALYPNDPFCCWSGRQTVLDRDGDGVDDRRDPDAMILAGFGSGEGTPGWVRVLDTLVRDLLAISIGTVGIPFGVLRGALRGLHGVSRLDLERVRGGLQEFSFSLVPRYGFWGGPFWGSRGLETKPLNALDEAFQEHDRAYVVGGQIQDRALQKEWIREADWKLVRDVWSPSRPQPGPAGQLYRIGVTAIFAPKAQLGITGL